MSQALARALALLLLCAGAFAAEPSGARLLVIGLDGASWNVVDPLIEAGQLPHLAALLRGGARAAPRSLPVFNPNRSNSAVIWTTYATGVDARSHGIKGFVRPPGETPGLYLSTDRRVRAFWNILAERGRSSAVVGWWTTWPAERGAGDIVTYDFWPMDRKLEGNCPGCAVGSSTSARRGEGLTAPPSLAAALRGDIVLETDLVDQDAFDVDSGTDIWKRFLWPMARDKTFFNVSRRLLATKRYDLLAVYFESLDVISHWTWACHTRKKFLAEKCGMYGVPALQAQKLERYYRWMDSLIGKLIAEAGKDAAVMVLSDHGFQTYEDLRQRELRLGRTVKQMTPEERGSYGATATDSYGHSPEALFILKAPGVRPGARVESASIYDVLPTLLYLQGLPVGADMPGRLMAEAFEPAYLAAHPARTVPTYERAPRPATQPLSRPAERDRGIVDKLKAAGYLIDY